MAATTPNSFDINIRHPSGGQSHIIHVRSDMTVEEVKQQFADRAQIDPSQFKLVFAGTMLGEQSTLNVSQPYNQNNNYVSLYMGRV